jgi:hypothetical protein
MFSKDRCILFKSSKHSVQSHGKEWAKLSQLDAEAAPERRNVQLTLTVHNLDVQHESFVHRAEMGKLRYSLVLRTCLLQLPLCNGIHMLRTMLISI